MCCRNRCRCRGRCRGREETAGTQKIALKGPGCISGTGRCEGVLGTGGRCRCELELGAICDQLSEDRGRLCCGQVLGSGGGFQCNDLSGSGRRCGRCKPSCWDLKTPTTVPR